MLTRQQAERLRLAIEGARGDSLQWTASGPLAQLALLEGHRPTDLTRWDESTDEDGRITVRRLVESGNAFGDWPLDVLEAIEVQWGRKADGKALMELVEQWSAAPAASDDAEERMTDDQQPKASSLTFAVDLKTILAFIVFITTILPVLVFVLQVRQDVRSNTLRAIAADARLEALELRVSSVEKDYQRSKLLFCAARDDTDTIRARELPDIGC